MLASMLVGHLAGDYLLQNDWMANGKKTKALPLLVHCGLYTLAVHASTMFALPTWALAIVAATHIAQDGSGFVDWYMNRIGQKGFREYLAPWSRIVVDNSMHAVVLWLVSILTP